MTQLGMGMEGMGLTLYGNGNGPYSHGNKFPSANAVFSLCNSNVPFIIIVIACNAVYTL